MSTVYRTLCLSLSVLGYLGGADAAHASTQPVRSIVGGQDVPADSYGFVGAIHFLASNDPKVTSFCTAVLVSRDTLLTAAHCVSPAPHTVRFTVGEQSLLDVDRYYAARAIYVPTSFGESGWTRDDLAVIKLAEVPVGVAPIAIAQASDAIEQGREHAIVLGWGADMVGEGFTQPSRLQMVEQTLYPKVECEDRLSYAAAMVNDSYLCAGSDDGIGACFGDSGGPLIVESATGGLVLAGVTSWGGEPCGTTATAFADLSPQSTSGAWLAQCLADETQCGSNTYEPTLTCADGSSIPAQWRCDGFSDCLDGTDELECEVKFDCSDGVQIDLRLLCDGTPDCSDGEDESEDVCGEVTRCDNGGLISKAWVCDGEIDCSDGSDEDDCPTIFVCQYGDVIPAELACNGVLDCPAGQDESTDTCEGMTHCDNGELVSQRFICDAIVDCADGSDESGEECAGEAPQLSIEQTVAPGELCEYGGTSITTGRDSNRNGQLEPNEVQDTSLVCDEEDADADEAWQDLLESLGCNVTKGTSPGTWLFAGIGLVFGLHRRRRPCL